VDIVFGPPGDGMAMIVWKQNILGDPQFAVR
jgi:hypothetical protein